VKVSGFKHSVRNPAFCLLFLSSTILAQTQLGSVINGEAADDKFGRAVALTSDGRRLAVGAPDNDSNGANAGQVRVFQWSNDDWSQLGSDIYGRAYDDNFGHSIAISSDGNLLAVGARESDANGVDSGQICVFEWSGGAWTQLGADIPGEDRYDLFGSSVSLSSEAHRVAVGAIFANGAAGQAGHARVYEWSGEAWMQLGSDIDGDAFEDGLGASVSLSADGSRLAVGAPQLCINNVPGYVRTFQWSGSEWVPYGEKLEGDVAGCSFGDSVSLTPDGNRLAVGAPFHVFGQVQVFEWINDAWIQVGTDIDGEADGDRSGDALSLSSTGNRLAIGAYGNDDFGTKSGQVRIYQWSGSAWQQFGSDINGNAEGDWLGSSVSISANGNRLAIGAPYAESGYVRVYSLNEFNQFTINAGLNDAWFNPATSGQGLLVTVFPDIKQMFLAWFTYDTERPPEDVTAFLGEPGHRWLTAQGPYDGDTATLKIFVTKGGVFDSPVPAAETDPAGDGTITLEFADCENGLVTYHITSLDISGEFPIERITADNVALCEMLSSP